MRYVLHWNKFRFPDPKGFVARMAKRGLEAYRDYRAQTKAGIEEPVFRKDCLSDDSGISSWD